MQIWSMDSPGQGLFLPARSLSVSWTVSGTPCTMSGPFPKEAASAQREENSSLSRRLSRHLGGAAGRDDGLLVTRSSRRRQAVLGVTREEDRIAFPFRFRELIKLSHLNTTQKAFSLFYFFLISSSHYPLRGGRKREIIPIFRCRT